MTVPICSVEDCERQIAHCGYCKLHYRRWKKHGDPLVVLNTGKPLKFIEEVVVKYEGDDCFKWPFGSAGQGRGSVSFRGRTVVAHRVVCILVHGEPEHSKMHAAHSCGNGHLGCVNPKHLRWATAYENAQDKYKHGTVLFGERHQNAKLTEQQVLEIRFLAKNGYSHSMLSKKFGISTGHVSEITSRRKWKYLADPAAAQEG